MGSNESSSPAPGSATVSKKTTGSENAPGYEKGHMVLKRYSGYDSRPMQDDVRQSAK